MRDGENNNAPIVSEISYGKWMALCCKNVLAFFSAVFVVSGFLFAVSFYFAISEGNAAAACCAVILAAIVVFGASFPLDVLTSLRTKGTKVMVLYSDRVVEKSFSKYGGFSETSCAPDEYTHAKEYKRYFKAWAAGKLCIVPKRGLNSEQQGAVRALFKLAAGEADLPAYDERKDPYPSFQSIMQADDRRCVRTGFCEYLSRDKSMLLLPRIISWLLLLPCAFGGVIYAAACRYYGVPPVWAVVTVWASAVAAIADIMWMRYMRRILKRSEQLEKDGTVSEYLFFSDVAVVYIRSRDFITLAVIPYGKVARVRENKTDILIDYPTKSGTYPVVKNRLAQNECNALRKLLSLKFTGEAKELDPAPSFTVDIAKRPDLGAER